MGQIVHELCLVIKIYNLLSNKPLSGLQLSFNGESLIDKNGGYYVQIANRDIKMDSISLLDNLDNISGYTVLLVEEIEKNKFAVGLVGSKDLIVNDSLSDCHMGNYIGLEIGDVYTIEETNDDCKIKLKNSHKLNEGIYYIPSDELTKFKIKSIASDNVCYLDKKISVGKQKKIYKLIPLRKCTLNIFSNTGNKIQYLDDKLNIINT